MSQHTESAETLLLSLTPFSRASHRHTLWVPHIVLSEVERRCGVMVWRQAPAQYVVASPGTATWCPVVILYYSQKPVLRRVLLGL